jgi:hypothetical protein
MSSESYQQPYLLSLQLLHTAEHILNYPTPIPQDPLLHAPLVILLHLSYILLSHFQNSYASLDISLY